MFVLGAGVIAATIGAAQTHPAPGTVYDAKWMWADNCLPLGCEVAKADPLGIRWSSWKSPQDTITRLKNEALQSHKKRGRPVHLKIRITDGERIEKRSLDDLSNIHVAVKELSRYVYQKATTTTTTTTTTTLAKAADEGWQIAQNSTSAHQSKDHVELTSDDIAEIEETSDFDAASHAVQDRTTENPPPQAKNTTSDEITEMEEMADFTSDSHVVQHQTSEDSPSTRPRAFVYKAPKGLVRPLSACFAVVSLGYVAMTLMQQRLPRSHQD